MKHAHMCPKCGSEDVVYVRHDYTRAGPGIPTQEFEFGNVPEERYVCCNCGYVEHWIDQETFVQRGGREFWQKKEEEYQAMLRRRASYDPEKEQRGTC